MSPSEEWLEMKVEERAEARHSTCWHAEACDRMAYMHGGDEMPYFGRCDECDVWERA